MKKLLTILLSVTIICSLFLCTACNEEDIPKPVTYEKMHNYCVYVDDTTFANAEIGQSYVIATPEVIDRSGTKVSGFTIKAKSVFDPRGKEVALTGGKIFLPELKGDYEVTFYCPDYDDVKEAITTITCIDTRGPIIDVSSLRSFMFVSEDIPVPDFEAIDRDGIDPSSKQVKLTNSSGEQIEPQDGLYKNLEEGYYTFNFSVKDVNGNASSTSKSIYITSQQQQDGKLTYFSESEYSKLIAKYDSYPLPNASWNSKVKTPDGEETMELSVTNDGTYNLTFALTCAITDWTSYDYFGVWVYNPTDIYLAAGLLGAADMDRGELNPKSWTYLVRKVGDSLHDAQKGVHKKSEYAQVVFSIFDAFIKDGKETAQLLNTSDKFLFGNFRLYNEEREDIVVGLGESYAMKYYGVHQKYMDLNFSTSMEHVFEGDSCSSKISMTENTIHSFNMRMDPTNVNVDNPRYLLNVYNANDYDIVIIDCPCDMPELQRGINCTENFTTIVKAHSSAQVLIQIETARNYLYIMAVKTDGSYVDKDFTIYLGNIKTTDNYTGDYTKWNDENGDSGIWVKYKKVLEEMTR